MQSPCALVERIANEIRPLRQSKPAAEWNFGHQKNAMYAARATIKTMNNAGMIIGGTIQLMALSLSGWLGILAIFSFVLT
jgi:hypothetical protein